MHEPIISVSGLRGIVGESLSPVIAMHYAAAFASSLPPGPIVVAHDGRITGPMLVDAVRSCLVGLGRSVIDADVASTPTVGALVREHEAAGGIQITASHNPPEYNGIKLFHGEGRVLTAEEGAPLIAAYRSSAPQWVPHEQIGRVIRPQDTTSGHIGLIHKVVNVEQIRRAQFRVLLDANHGSGSVLGKPLLESLGCVVQLVGGEPDGFFEHPAEPTQKNLEDLLPVVRDGDFSVAFCQDPDADRLAIVDEKGRYLGEELTLAICVDHVLREQPGPVVVNCATSRVSQDLAEKYGVPLLRSQVGEAHVVAMMKHHNAVLGGEGNGGVIHPKVGYVRDSFVGMALVLDCLAARNTRASALADALPEYAMHKIKIALEPEKIEMGMARLRDRFADARASDLDGLRFDWPDRWLLVRKSNTEPIMRAIAEAPTEADAVELCAAATEAFA